METVDFVVLAITSVAMTIFLYDTLFPEDTQASKDDK
jgi:hypothetical protein